VEREKGEGKTREKGERERRERREREGWGGRF
jgi:hypothetical protein